MKEYNVHLYFEGSYCADILAESEDEALEIAKSNVLGMNDTDFINAIEPQYTGYDVY
jgi:hypothetical protein